MGVFDYIVISNIENSIQSKFTSLVYIFSLIKISIRTLSISYIYFNYTSTNKIFKKLIVGINIILTVASVAYGLLAITISKY